MTKSNMKEHSTEIAEFIAGSEHGPLIEQLIELIAGAAPGLEAAVKWNNITFTADGDWHNWILGIGTAKKHIRLVFHRGAKFSDPDGLLEGSGDYIKHLKISGKKDMVTAKIKGFIGQALSIRR